MTVRALNEDSEFLTELQCSGTKLVVVDFTASWCGPCQRIAPIFEKLAAKYARAVFVKVDVDKCQNTAASQGVSAMPTFIFYRNKAKIDRLQGADPNALESKIQQYYGDDGDDEEGSGIPGHMDLSTFIQKGQCEALNESDDHPLAHALTNDERYLESDCDEQLILSFQFMQAVKLHSIKVKAPQGKGPKVLKLFINQPNALDFDSAAKNVAVQELELSPEDLDGRPVNLRFVKFQSVHNLYIFVLNNHEGGEVTRIDHISLIGSPVATMNMGDLKRVSGQKGEAHF
ncbi:unnamed protein product [Bemisia tabaci]|uniref:Thioredoxin-like protein 1 n=1 Tax=Bemisia tabaci TaxID=7038 RepID=A0A9P0AJC2_BEMTA|nr:PREDICTED: thioredoxin-like protein 1 [Bemisia tabaci]CAH0391737.1 unnamed protein product [Bemisia tabaci]